MSENIHSTQSDPVSGLIIAGGYSRRLGQDKRKLRLWGEDKPTLLEHTVSVLSSLCEEVIVVLNDPENWEHLPAQLVTDVFENAGPLGGLYSGLSRALHSYALVVAADMPLLNTRLLQAMLALPRNFDALVPYSMNKARNTLNAETLHAIYSRRHIGLLYEKLQHGMRSIADYLAIIDVKYLEPMIVGSYDPNGYSFSNINTPDDLAGILAVLSTT
jgi:molybdenum cofactor guanylyltransferase